MFHALNAPPCTSLHSAGHGCGSPDGDAFAANASGRLTNILRIGARVAERRSALQHGRARTTERDRGDAALRRKVWKDPGSTGAAAALAPPRRTVGARESSPHSFSTWPASACSLPPPAAARGQSWGTSGRV